MENKTQGYKIREYHGPVKRYCQMLNLKDDPALIAEYRKRHSEEEVWPETLAAIRVVGFLVLVFYIFGSCLFSIGIQLWLKWPHCPVRKNGKTICLFFNRQNPELLQLKNGS